MPLPPLTSLLRLERTRSHPSTLTRRFLLPQESLLRDCWRDELAWQPRVLLRGNEFVQTLTISTRGGVQPIRKLLLISKTKSPSSSFLPQSHPLSAPSCEYPYPCPCLPEVYLRLAVTQYPCTFMHPDFVVPFRFRFFAVLAVT